MATKKITNNQLAFLTAHTSIPLEELQSMSYIQAGRRISDLKDDPETRKAVQEYRRETQSGEASQKQLEFIAGLTGRDVEEFEGMKSRQAAKLITELKSIPTQEQLDTLQDMTGREWSSDEITREGARVEIARHRNARCTKCGLTPDDVRWTEQKCLIPERGEHALLPEAMNVSLLDNLSSAARTGVYRHRVEDKARERCEHFLLFLNSQPWLESNDCIVLPYGNFSPISSSSPRRILATLLLRGLSCEGISMDLGNGHTLSSSCGDSRRCTNPRHFVVKFKNSDGNEAKVALSEDHLDLSRFLSAPVSEARGKVIDFPATGMVH